jgi:hypothetical protein
METQLVYDTTRKSLGLRVRETILTQGNGILGNLALKVHGVLNTRTGECLQVHHAPVVSLETACWCISGSSCACLQRSRAYQNEVDGVRVLLLQVSWTTMAASQSSSRAQCGGATFMSRRQSCALGPWSASTARPTTSLAACC